MFNYCFVKRTVPDEWFKAKISPILKPNKDDTNPLNYRGISLLSCVSKLYSAIIESRITNFCDNARLIVDEQNGFSKDHSCTDHVYFLTTIIRNILNSGNDICSLLLTWRKLLTVQIELFYFINY